MNELEFKELVDKTVKECYWRQEVADIILCRAECLPCKRWIMEDKNA